eukprot:6572286-Alexandrium_andersonii.AAC.1
MARATVMTTMIFTRLPGGAPHPRPRREAPQAHPPACFVGRPRRVREQRRRELEESMMRLFRGRA